MKKLIFFISLLIFSSGNLLSQSGWFWQNPKQVGENIEDVFFVSDFIGYAISNNGIILKTSNSGESWLQLNTGCHDYLSSLYFINEFTGYVTTGYIYGPTNNVVLKTTDGGFTWLQKEIFYNTLLCNIKFINDNTGFIVGGKFWYGGNIYKTTDSGNSWIQYPQLQTNFMKSVYFVNSDTGYVAGDDGKILKTTNCGLNWFFLNTGNNYTGFYNINFINFQTGYAVGGGGKIYMTSNYGNNWNEQNSGVTTGLAYVNFKDINTGIITGNSGLILRTTNGGIGWLAVNSNSLFNLRGFKFLSDIVITVGQNGEILKSSNNGLNWISLRSSLTNRNIYSSCKLDSVRYFAVGDSGTILNTLNGGINWFVQTLPGKYSLKAIQFVDNNTGFIVAGYSSGNNYYSKIYKSTNSGEQWELKYGLNYEQGFLNSVKFINYNLGFAVGTSGKILKTTNSGENWFLSNSGVSSILFSVDFKDENTGFVCGTEKIMRTTNSGVTWQSNAAIDFLNVIKCLPNNVIIAAGSNKVLKSTNNGDNWINLAVPVATNYLSIGFNNDNNNGWISSNKSILKTIDGGSNWYQQCNVTKQSLNSVLVIDIQKCFMFGDYGTILKTINGGSVIAIYNSSTSIPHTYSLHQNYPNPFNPVTKISFDIPKQSNVQIIIYDLLGRVITTLLNEELQPGSYSVDWDASGFANGVYFYSLVTDEFTETKRMVLLK